MKNKTTDYINYPDKSRGNLAVINPPSSAFETDSFRVAIRDWLDAGRANGLSTKTLIDYENKAFKFWWWWREHTRYASTLGPGPEHVSVKEARQFVAYLRTSTAFRWGITDEHSRKKSEELSPASIAAYGRTLKAFFNWLEAESYIEETPLTKKVSFATTKQDKIIKRLEDSDIEKIFTYLLKPERRAEFDGARDLAIVSLLLDSGIRRGELVGMKVRDVNFETARFEVRGKRDRRYIPLSPLCKRQLFEYATIRDHTHGKPGPDGAMWLTADGAPLSYDGFASMLRRVRRATGVKFHAHMFRHTAASKLAEADMPPFLLKELLGHASISTTQIYVQGSPAKVAEAHRERSPLASVGAIQSQLKKRPGRPKKNQPGIDE
jgi:integrase/recombinase XerD